MTTHDASIEENLSSRVEATGRVIANFAWQHLKAASTFRNQVVEFESKNAQQPFGSFFEDIRSFGSACIMSAAASLEALINEFFITPEGPLRQKLSNFEVEFWESGGIERKPPLKKYQLAPGGKIQPSAKERTANIKIEGQVIVRWVFVAGSSRFPCNNIR